MLGDACCRCFHQMIAAETDDVSSVMLMYQLQAEQFREDFEHEREDHQRTKAQVESLTNQWNCLFDQLRQCQAKVCSCG